MIPNLLHPVPIIIAQVETGVSDETEWDEDARESIGNVDRGDPVTVSGQVEWRSAKEIAAAAGGVDEDAIGYVLFRFVDLEAAGITLRAFDRFTKIGNEVTDVYILRLEPTGHYPDQGGATMVKAHFSDRTPAQQPLR